MNNNNNNEKIIIMQLDYLQSELEAIAELPNPIRNYLKNHCNRVFDIRSHLITDYVSKYGKLPYQDIIYFFK